MSTILDLIVTASSNDCDVYWDGSAWVLSLVGLTQRVGYTNATALKEGGGMRFLNVTIPKDATIDTAYLTFKASDTRTGTTVNSKIRGEASDNPITFSTLADYQGRAKTTAVVNWDAIPAWTLDTDYNSPEIKTIIQELVNRAGWASGNALAIFWDDHDDLSTHATGCRRQGKAYDTDTTYCARLHIEYTPPAAGGARSFGYIMG